MVLPNAPFEWSQPATQGLGASRLAKARMPQIRSMWSLPGLRMTKCRGRCSLPAAPFKTQSGHAILRTDVLPTTTERGMWIPRPAVLDSRQPALEFIRRHFGGWPKPGRPFLTELGPMPRASDRNGKLRTGFQIDDFVIEGLSVEAGWGISTAWTSTSSGPSRRPEDPRTTRGLGPLLEEVQVLAELRDLPSVVAIDTVSDPERHLPSVTHGVYRGHSARSGHGQAGGGNGPCADARPPGPARPGRGFCRSGRDDEPFACRRFRLPAHRSRFPHVC